jgi:hypothetical protein
MISPLKPFAQDHSALVVRPRRGYWRVAATQPMRANESQSSAAPRVCDEAAKPWASSAYPKDLAQAPQLGPRAWLLRPECRAISVDFAELRSAGNAGTGQTPARHLRC